LKSAAVKRRFGKSGLKDAVQYFRLNGFTIALCRKKFFENESAEKVTNPILWSIFSEMTEDKRKVLEAVLKECFWGDYSISPREAEEKLAEEDGAFERFLAGRIVSDSPFPSARLKALFPEKKLRPLLDSLILTGRAAQRRSLAKAVIFYEPWEREPSWIRS
jgi:hypothetical protein